MYHNDYDKKHLLIKQNLNREEMLKSIKNMLSAINMNKEDYAIYQHLIWTRYDTLEDIKEGTLKNGLFVRTVGLASTTMITGNTKLITPEEILSYSYAEKPSTSKSNLGFSIPLSIRDEYGRKIYLALDKTHDSIPWDEGKKCSILDFIIDKKKHLSNSYTLFAFDINPSANEYSYVINKNAFPFLSEKEKQAHYRELSSIIKEILVNQYHILSEDEYKKAKDINPYIEKLIETEYEKVKGQMFDDPIYWEEP